MAVISKAERDAMPESHFAFPRTRQGPMPDAAHAKLAWDMIERTKGVTDEERKAAPSRVLARAKELGIDTDGWRKLKAMHFEVESLDAMALMMPDVTDHPNRMPFSGVLTKLDQPSDRPVHGSLGKLVVIPRAVAEAALPSLLGMAVDFTPGLDGHDPKQKIGIFTAAYIDGDDLRVEGFLYAADFPEEAALIKARKSELGFSYETAQNFTDSLDTEHLVLAACTFTGAAILRKDKAAYQTTSLAAAAAGEIDMTKEELEAAIKAGVTAATADLQAQLQTLQTSLKASEETRGKVEPHAKALEACADSMDAAAVGGHPQNGHAAVIRRMAGSMRAEAAMGKIPHIWRDHDYPMYAAADDRSRAAPAETEAEKALKAQLADITTKLNDLKAAAADASAAPERKTVPPQITSLLAKAGFGPNDDGKVSVSKLDAALAAGNLDARQRIAFKRQLERDGLLAA